MDNPYLSAWAWQGVTWGGWLPYAGAMYLWIWDHAIETWLHRRPPPSSSRLVRAHTLHPRMWPYYRMVQGLLLIGTAVFWVSLLWGRLSGSAHLGLAALLLYVLPVLGTAVGRWWGHRRPPWAGWAWRPAWVILSVEALLLEPFGLMDRALGLVQAATPDLETETPESAAPAEEVTFQPETVEDILIPRTDLTAYSVDTPVEEIARALLQTHYSWAVVYDTVPERWVGVVTWEHLIEGLLTDPKRPIRQVGWAEPLTVPEGQRLVTLWRTWSTGYPPVAFVYDEYGEILGLLRWVDLAASLARAADREVGAEDYARRYYETWSENEWVVRGRCPIELFWQMANLDPGQMPQHLETVAGWVASMVPHLPVVGEVIQWNGLEFTILEVKGRRLEKIRVVRRPPAPPDHVPDEGDQTVRP